MKRNLSFVIALSLCLALLAGCGSGGSEEKVSANPPNESAPAQSVEEPSKMTLYTVENEAFLNAVIPEFEKMYNVKVEIITAKTGELIKRIESEKDKPIGDVFLGSNPSMLSGIEDLFEEYVSVNDAEMEEDYRNIDGRFTPYRADGSVLLVSKALAESLGVEINGYEDLLSPALKGKIALGDSSSSSSAFEHLVNILVDFSPEGENESDKGWSFVADLVENADGKILNSSGAVHKGVADGEYVVGLTWEDPAATYVKDGGNVEVVYMKEGVVFVAATAQIIKGAGNPEVAKKFIDYLTGESAQNFIGTELCSRPLRTNVTLGTHLIPLSDINIKNSDRRWATASKEALGLKFQNIVIENAE